MLGTLSSTARDKVVGVAVDGVVELLRHALYWHNWKRKIGREWS